MAGTRASEQGPFAFVGPGFRYVASERLASERALAWGLVTKVVEDERVLEEALKMARQLARGSLHSFGWSKELLTDSSHTPFEAQLEKERTGICSCGAHADGKEGLRAFQEKRKPVFGG